MKIGLKYCGGCNPKYNRSFIPKRVKEMFPWIQVEAAEKGISYDWVFVICGCRAECIDVKGFKGSKGVFIIYSIEQYMEIEEGLTKELEENKNQYMNTKQYKNTTDQEREHLYFGDQYARKDKL